MQQPWEQSGGVGLSRAGSSGEGRRAMRRKVGDRGGVREELWGSDPVSGDIWGQLTSLSLSFLIYK